MKFGNNPQIISDSLVNCTKSSNRKYNKCGGLDVDSFERRLSQFRVFTVRTKAVCILNSEDRKIKSFPSFFHPSEKNFFSGGGNKGSCLLLSRLALRTQLYTEIGGELHFLSWGLLKEEKFIFSYLQQKSFSVFVVFTL